jgi:hypothetical protein
MSKRSKAPAVSVALWDKTFDRVWETLAEETNRAQQAGANRSEALGSMLGGAFMAVGAWLDHVGPYIDGRPPDLLAADLAMKRVVGALAAVSDAVDGRSEMDTMLATMRAIVRQEEERVFSTLARAATPGQRPQ